MGQDRTLSGSFLFGFGVIAMVDGIIFHQLLQWHSTYMWTPNRFAQIFSDGVLHVVATCFIIAGTLVLWTSQTMPRAVRGVRFLSGFFLGGGLFNLLDGILSHHVLNFHHVRPGSPNQLLYDLAFDLSALLMLALGFAFYRNSRYRRHM